MSLILTGLTKRYGETRAVSDLSLTVASGETVALLGPSGCGKSTLLRLVAGLESPDSGSLTMDGDDITHLRADRRGFGVVFQDYALFPHLSVAGNVGFGLVERRVERDVVAATTSRLLGMVGLAGFERRRVDQLSGGQQQRVALARALAHEPRLLLLDEPLSNLDEALREELKDLVAALLDELGTQAIYVTHDQREAFGVADRVAVMRAGRLVQVGTRAELLERPRDAWLARFLGYDNVWEGPAADALAHAAGTTAGRGGLALRSDLLSLRPPDAPNGMAGTVVAVRPAALQIALEIEVSAWESPAWGAVSVRWEGHQRELDALAPGWAPALGDEVALAVPSHAWLPLEGA